MKTNKPDLRPEDRDRQPRMTRMARMKRNFPTENPEPTCRDGARARRVRPKPHEENAFLIRAIREIRGFSSGTRLKPQRREERRERKARSPSALGSSNLLSSREESLPRISRMAQISSRVLSVKSVKSAVKSFWLPLRCSVLFASLRLK